MFKSPNVEPITTVTGSVDTSSIPTTFEINNLVSMPDYGAKVMVQFGTHKQMQELSTSAGFLSQNSPVLHFGLEDWNQKCENTVMRTNGQAERYLSVSPNQRMILKTGVSEKH